MFQQMVSDALCRLNRYELQNNSDFQDYMSNVEQVMTSLNENVISLAIAVYIHFHNPNKTL